MNGATRDADDDRRRALVLVALGRARLFKGDEINARALFMDAADIARRLSDHELLAEAALGYGARIRESEVLPDLVSLLEEALAKVSPTSLLRCRVMARLASAQQPARDCREPMKLAREAFALARATGHKPTILGALFDGMGALVDTAQPKEREPINLEVLRLAEELGDRPRAQRTRLRLLADAIEQDPLNAEARIAAFEAALEDGELPQRALVARAIVAIARGDREGALALAARATERPSTAVEPAGVLRGAIAQAFERGDELRAQANVMRELPVPPEWRPFFLTVAAVWTGVADDEPTGDVPLMDSPLHDRNFAFLAAFAASEQRNADVCRAIVAWHRDETNTLQTFFGMVPTALYLARAAVVAGDAGALALFDTALAFSRRTAIPIAIARSCIELAAHLLETSAHVDADRQRAASLLDEAAPIVDRLDLARSRRQVAALRARLTP